MMIPSIHLNGTSKKELLKQANEAGIAVGSAIAKLRESTPHGRDYYPQDGQGPTGKSYDKAFSEYLSRVEKLQSVYNELLELAEAIWNGGFKR